MICRTSDHESFLARFARFMSNRGVTATSRQICWLLVCFGVVGSISCRRRKSTESEDQRVHDSQTPFDNHVAAVQKVLRTVHVQYESRGWRSPLSTDEKFGFGDHARLKRSSIWSATLIGSKHKHCGKMAECERWPAKRGMAGASKRNS